MASKKWRAWVLASASAAFSYAVVAAEREPIGRKIDNAQVMERVQLVGVIAGSNATSGIAVIKDSQTGRTYAIKTGDVLPGVPNIKLQRVQRELAIFNGDGKEYPIRLALGGYAQDAEDDEDLNADLGKSNGPGLFEKWYGSKVGVGPDRVERNSIHDGESASDQAPQAKQDITEDQNKSGSIDEATKLREDRDGPLNDYLKQLTRGSGGVHKRPVKQETEEDSR
jgi:type II secretory pathway component PulC